MLTCVLLRKNGRLGLLQAFSFALNVTSLHVSSCTDVFKYSQNVRFVYYQSCERNKSINGFVKVLITVKLGYNEQLGNDHFY